MSSSSGDGPPRVSIPDSVRKAIQEIREITGKQHSDEDIFSVLTDCFMDPNDTAQKLMYLDTFHEVKNRRDRRKENIKKEASGDFKMTTRAWGPRDSRDRRNFAIGRDGVSHSTWRESRASMISSVPVSRKTKTHAAPLRTKDSSDPQEGSADVKNVGPSPPPPTVDEIKQEVRSQHIIPDSNHVQVKDQSASNLCDSELSKTEKAVSKTVNSKKNRKNSTKSMVVGKNKPSEPSHSLPSSFDAENQVLVEPVVPLEVLASKDAIKVSETNIDIPGGQSQHVIFPKCLKVPEELRRGFVFGSFDAIPNVKSSQESDETAREPSSNPSAYLTLQGVDHLEDPEPLVGSSENISSADGKVSPVTVLKFDNAKQDTLLCGEVTLDPAVQNAPNSSIGLLEPVSGTQIAKFEGPESQARDFSDLPDMSGSSAVLSLENPIHPVADVGQNHSHVSPQPIPVVRQSYPHYFPYGPYYPFFVPPVHPYLSVNGFPQHPSGNVFLPPSAAAAGVTHTLPPFKPGSNVPSPTNIAPSAYASYSSSHLGYGPSPALTTISSNGNANLAPLHSKENQVFQNAGSAVRLPASDQELLNQPLNSMYAFLPPGQHVNFAPSQAGSGTYPSLYQMAHTMGSLPTAFPLMQQSQTMAGGVVNNAPQSGVHQHTE